nr:aldo/keto reductase [Devosia oryzisoli]
MLQSHRWRGRRAAQESCYPGYRRSLDRTAAQVVIRWHLQLGLIPLPKTSKPERAVENFDVWDFTLSEDQMKRIEGLDRPDGKTLTQPNDMNNLF